MSRFDEFKKGLDPLPEKQLAWQVFGAGFENLGRDGKPQTLALRGPKEDEILCRVDTLGLCLSDIKIITQGSQHARLRGRDLANDPTVLGHECAVTVVKVGEKWAKDFAPGQRFLVQADIYFKGLNYAFGYLIPGGMEQYCYLDERALAGDEGCYLLPIKPETGYSEAALAEPWACVEMSYQLEERTTPGGGDMLIVADDAAVWTAQYPTATIVPSSLDGLTAEGQFDDIIITAPTTAIVNALAPRIRKNGVMFLLGAAKEAGTVSIDIGRIHYENVRFYGGADTMEGVAKANSRNDLLPGGSAVFIGAGGPMGQMHVQRAIETQNGPKRVVVTDLDRARMDHIENRFKALAESKGVELITLAPSQFDSPAAMDAHVRSLAPNGYSDVIVLAPVAALVKNALTLAADHAFVNVFAGLIIGSVADLQLNDFCRGIKIIGSSGSRISDLRRILTLVEAKQLNSNLSVAAIGGLMAAREGLEGVKAARFPGKTVIYPHIVDLPLMSIEEVPEKLPQLKDKLSPEGAWTNAAEQALLEMFV